MKLFYYLATLVLIQGIQDSDIHIAADFCAKLEALAQHFDLLTAISVIPDPNSKGFDVPPCDLSWNGEKIIMKRFDKDPKKHYSKTFYNHDPTLSKDLIQTRLLIMPRRVIKRWQSYTKYMYLNGHLLGLVGGICERYSEVVAFTFDLKTEKAYELGPKGQREELVMSFKTRNTPLARSRGLYHKQKYFLELDRHSLTEHSLKWKQKLEKQRHKLLTKEGSLQVQLQAVKMNNPYEQLPDPEVQIQGLQRQQKEMKKRRRRLEKKIFSLELLFYHDLGPIEKAVDLVNIPLNDEKYSSTDEIEVSEDVPAEEKGGLKVFLRAQSIFLVRLVQLIKHFKAKSHEDTALEGAILKPISNLIDTFDMTACEAEKDQLIKELLLTAIELVPHSSIMPECTFFCYLHALCRLDDQIRNLFVNPRPEIDALYIPKRSSDLDQETFNDSIWDQILVRGVWDRTIHLTLELSVKEQKMAANFELFAFISNKHVLYIFKRIADRITVSIYGDSVEEKIINIELGLDTEGTATLELSGCGLAFYRYRPSHHRTIKATVS